MSRSTTSTMPDLHTFSQGIGNELNMAERLGLGPEVRELKLGSTFTSNISTAFHTLKYDFKPASVDVSKIATVDVGADNTSMTVTVPHLDGAGTSHTVFKGSQRPHHKECVLIIDKITGEIMLERLTANIQVKKTRKEPMAKSHLGVSNGNSTTTGSSSSSSNNNGGGGGRPITPVEMKRSPTHGRLKGRTKVISGTKREPFVQLHPKGQTPPYQIPNSCSPAQSSNAQSTLASLPMINSEIDDFALSAPMVPTPNRTSPSVSVANTKSVPSNNNEGALSDSSSSSSSSDSSDSDSDVENVPVPTAANGNMNSTTSSPVMQSLMPDNFLNEDLQLSESESDSDRQ